MTLASGPQGTFITRNQALRKLQLSLAQFRYVVILHRRVYCICSDQRNTQHATTTNNNKQQQTNNNSKLCILKGIYPREPTHKRKGHDKTYYLVKDIAFLAHDPIIESMRKQKTWSRRITKAVHKKERSRVQVLMQNKPRYRLDHIIRERYVIHYCVLALAMLVLCSKP
jgi:hypothetical protein